MILRKPYAILIKNFKLIHIILAIFMGYLFYKTNMVLSFLNEYLSSVATTISSDVTSSLFGPLLIISLIIVILGSIIILSLMHFKDKPVKFYIFNILIHIILAVFYYVTFSIIKSLEVGLVDIRVLKVIHDFTLIALMIQFVGLIFVIFRATGFDIKNFDFKKDLEDLNITTSDNEEFEVDLEVDTGKLKRKFNKKIRHLRYIYLENKLLFNIIGSISIALISFLIYLNVGVYNKTFQLDEAFKTNQFIFNFTDSYVTKYDYQGVEIKKDYQYVAIKLSIKKLYNQNINLKTAKFYLNVGGKKFYHTTNYKDRLFALGETYINQDITTEFQDYILVFEIPDSLIRKKMILNYVDNNNDIIKINVGPSNLNKKNVKESASLTQALDFKDSPLKEVSMKINSYEIAPTFTLHYNYCVSSSNCYDSIEYLKDKYFTACNAEGKLGVIDENENTKIDFKYTTIQKIEGTDLIQATQDNNTIEIYSKEFQKISELDNAKIEQNSNYIKLYNNDEIKYIANEGKELKNTELFKDNKIFAIKQNDKWGFADANGKIIVECKYDEVTEVNKYGFAGIKLDNLWGIVNSEGKIIVKPKYKINESNTVFIGEYYKVTYGSGENYYSK